MPKFEDCLQRLEKIVQELEKGDVPLEKSLTLFEEGMQNDRASSAAFQLAKAERDGFARGLRRRAYASKAAWKGFHLLRDVVVIGHGQNIVGLGSNAASDWAVNVGC